MIYNKISTQKANEYNKFIKIIKWTLVLLPLSEIYMAKNSLTVEKKSAAVWKEKYFPYAWGKLKFLSFNRSEKG